MAKDAPSRPTGRARSWLADHKNAVIWAGGAVALAASGVALIAALDWNQLRGPISRIASARTGREIAILGDLDVRPLGLRPSATIEGLRIGNPAWAGPGRMAQVERVEVQIEALPLLTGRVVMPRLALVRPDFDLIRDKDGRANWSFAREPRRERPFRIPPVRDFTIQDGKLKFQDARRRLTLDATLNAAERADAVNRGFLLTGKGSINRAPFLIEVTGGPLLNISPDKPYPFDADVRAGATRILARGAILKPFDLGRFEARGTASGSDLADLYDLTGVPFPNTPPYRLSGRLSREMKLWRVTGVGGRVGDSDMAGNLSVDTARERPFVTADMRSRRLDFDDLAAVFGGAPARGAGETVSDEQRAMGQRMAAERRLLPDARIDLARVRAVDADVKYSAAAIHSPRLPLRSGSVRLRLDRGLLVADPLRLELSRGALAGQARLDGRRATPVSSIDLRLSKARLEQILPVRGGGAPLTGGLVGRIKLTGAGASVRQAAANADGQVLVVVPSGEIRAAFAELLGINVVRGLGLLLAKDQSKTDVRCAVAHFQARNGVLTADRIIFDTGPVLGTGEGRVDLRNERMELRITGHPKEPRLIRVMAPIRLEGPIVRPKIGVEASKALTQGGLAAALGALVAPLAAILPFVDLGTADDAACGALIAQAGRQGAPVGPARR